MAREQSISWFVGEDIEIDCTIEAQDGSGPLDISGKLFSFIVENAAGAAVITKTVGAGITITDGPAGELTVIVPAAASSGLSPDFYNYRVEQTTSGSDAVMCIGTLALQRK